jgi:hypothetical protein
MTVMVVVPTARGIAPEAVPEATAVPLTFTVALESVVVGVRVSLLTVLATLSV